MHFEILIKLKISYTFDFFVFHSCTITCCDAYLCVR